MKNPLVEELAHLFHLTVGELPVADFDRVKPGVVEDVIAIVEVHRLFDGANVDAGESPECGGDVPVGSAVIRGPARATVFPVAAAKAAARTTTIDDSGVGGIHEAGEDPLGFFLIIGRDGSVVLAGIFAPGHLHGKGAAEGDQADACEH